MGAIEYESTIYVDHHQFYIHDAAPEIDLEFTFDDLDSAVEEGQTHRALMISTRRAVGHVPVILEMHDRRPDVALDEWDSVVACSLRIESAAVRVSAPWSDTEPMHAVPSAQYAALICFGDTDTAPYDDDFGADHYRVLLWPGQYRPVTVLKRSNVVEDDPLPYGGVRSVAELGTVARVGATSERLHALVALCRIGSPEAIVAVGSALDGAPASVPQIAASALALSGARGGTLLVALLRHPDAQTRARAAQALARVPAVHAVAPLVENLADADRNVRFWTTRAVGRLASPDALPLLLPLLDDARGEVRLAAIQALDELGQRDLGFAALGAAAPRLQALLTDADGAIRERAVSVLGAIFAACPDISPPTDLLLARLRDGDWQEREHVARALGQSRDPRAVGPLIEALHDEHFRVHMQAALALGELGDRRAVPALVELAQHASPDVSRCAQAALNALGGTP